VLTLRALIDLDALSAEALLGGFDHPSLNDPQRDETAASPRGGLLATSRYTA